MKKIIFCPLVFFAVVTIFSSGIVLGVYYHNEFTVIWSSVFHLPNQTASGSIVPLNLETTSAINLPTLDAPLPLVFSDTLDEDSIQQQLKEGAVVLPLGTTFGESGNVVITAHSSGTESFGPYRFAFSKLSELTVGSIFSVTTPTATYHYRVYDKEVVWPHEVDKLPQDDKSTVTLVTCWPLWTNFKRLLVHSELTNTDYNL